MGESGFERPHSLPGTDVLREIRHDTNRPLVDDAALEPFLHPINHRTYLEHPIFDQYLKMHKVTTGISGAKELEVIGRQLETEYMPLYKDAAAWAYAEAGLIDTSLSALERVRHVVRAEELWEEAARIELAIQSSPYGEFFDEPSAPYRYALPLAFSPLLKALIVGNVTPTLRQQSFVDTVSFGTAVAHEIGRYRQEGNVSSANLFVGLQHELNALSTLLYLDDPRYIPFPSTARADTGYYHPEQTHDIMVVHQHWGTIRKVIPMEIKAKASRRDRRRYKSLLVRGKMHLVSNGTDPNQTAQSYGRLVDGSADIHDLVDVERIATDLREMLRLYQQGITPESLAVRSLTKFQESRSLQKAHPEIAP